MRRRNARRTGAASRRADLAIVVRNRVGIPPLQRNRLDRSAAISVLARIDAPDLALFAQRVPRYQRTLLPA